MTTTDLSVTPVPAPERPRRYFPTAGIAHCDRLLAILATAVVAVISVAAYESGRLLLAWDEPIQQAVVANRHEVLDGFFLAATSLGTTGLVIPLAAIGIVATWRRCRAVAIALVAATLGRLVVETFLKHSIERSRPQLAPLASYGGFAFPSGHVLGSIALWGMLPVVVSVFTASRRAWWVSTAVSGTVIGSVAASRVYLGAHWFSDVVAGLAIGIVFLVAVQAVFDRQHGRRPCAHDHRPTE